MSLVHFTTGNRLVPVTFSNTIINQDEDEGEAEIIDSADDTAAVKGQNKEEDLLATSSVGNGSREKQDIMPILR
jgi:hypothetical protein